MVTSRHNDVHRTGDRGGDIEGLSPGDKSSIHGLLAAGSSLTTDTGLLNDQSNLQNVSVATIKHHFETQCTPQCSYSTYHYYRDTI